MWIDAANGTHSAIYTKRKSSQFVEEVVLKVVVALVAEKPVRSHLRPRFVRMMCVFLCETRARPRISQFERCTIKELKVEGNYVPYTALPALTAKIRVIPNPDKRKSLLILKPGKVSFAK